MAEIQALRSGMGLLPVLGGCKDVVPDPAPSPAPVANLNLERDASALIREASGVAVVGGGRMILIASDEEDRRIFGMSPDSPGRAWPLPIPDGAEAIDDIESLVALSDTEVLAISSFSRNKEGQEKPKRGLAARIRLDPTLQRIDAIHLLPPMRPAILAALSENGGFEAEELSQRKPNDGGLNVEGAAMWGEQLVLGLREPVAQGGGAFLLGFGDVLRSGRSEEEPTSTSFRSIPASAKEGIRDLATLDGRLVLLLGGSRDEDRIPRHLVRWDGAGTPRELPRPGRKELENAEGIAFLPDGRLVVAYDVEEGVPVRIFDP